uniref:hypothetical protein n=1 Tax=Halomonas sp. TaxID=1486246 RepID=UPI00262FFED6|nr:hypothetical protein [Halomonas sp.]
MSRFDEGFAFAMGTMVAICVCALVYGVISRVDNHKDDSDPVDGRSGVSVVTDAKTGLQYLRAPGGGITPRLTIDGKHMKDGDA